MHISDVRESLKMANELAQKKLEVFKGSNKVMV